MLERDRILAAFRYGKTRTTALSRASTEWWLQEKVLSTDRALEEATRAVQAFERGEVRRALHHAGRACAWERREFVKCRTWYRLRRALRAAAIHRHRAAHD
jgi:hypothetical protein